MMAYIHKNHQDIKDCVINTLVHLRDRRNKASSFLLAIWTDKDGLRSPEKELHYMRNKVKIGLNY